MDRLKLVEDIVKFVVDKYKLDNVRYKINVVDENTFEAIIVADVVLKDDESKIPMNLRVATIKVTIDINFQPKEWENIMLSCKESLLRKFINLCKKALTLIVRKFSF